MSEENNNSYSKWENFNSAWNSYFSKHVIENQHLSIPLKHAFLGTIIPTIFIFGTRKISARISLFCIQNSGTGKSEGMKATDKALQKLGMKSFYTLKVTDAKLTGSIDEPKKGQTPIRTKGLLEEYDFIGFDEGSILLKNGPYNETLQDVLQMALDEPGQISRAVKHGIIQYPTNTTIVTGSYPVLEMGVTIMSRGLFQRFYMIYHKVTDEDIKQIDDQFNRLCDSNTLNIEPEIKKFKSILKDFPQTIEINKEAFNKIHEDEIKKFRDDSIFQQYKDGRGEILTSFWFRMRIKMLKFAVHYAVMNNKKEIDYESLKYGFEMMKEEIKAIKQILEETVIQQDNSKVNWKEIVTTSLKEPKPRPDLLECLKNDKRWICGYNRTIERLEEMEEEKLIKVDRDKKPHIYHVFI